MIRKLILIGLAGLGLSACQPAAGTASYAVDVNSDGVVDCQDVDHVHMCLHYIEVTPGDRLCSRADVSGDGVIDDEDIHGMYAGVTEMGYQCQAQVQHNSCGTECDTDAWETMAGPNENEWEHEYEHEQGCEDGECPGEQKRFRKRCRCRLRGCVGEDCPNCPEDCGCPDDGGDGGDGDGDGGDGDGDGGDGDGDGGDGDGDGDGPIIL